MTEATCYLERSKVREILLGQPDESLYITEEILREVDALPIHDAASIGGVAQAVPGRLAIALEIWHRFADSGVEEWAYESHKAEYLLCADAILALSPAILSWQPTDAMIEAGARELWNDRDARMGGPWDSRDPQEVCVIQTKATMRAALAAALAVSSTERK